MAIQFEDKEWRKLIISINKRVKDPKPLIRAAFSVRGFRDIIQHFENEKGPQKKWPKLKIRQGKALQDTGNLRNKFLPGNLENKGRDSVLFFNSATDEKGNFYGKIHDEGIGVPKREFMYLTDKAQDDMINIILNRIVR